MAADGEEAGQPVCYLKGVDVSTLSKSERRRLTKEAKKALKAKQVAKGEAPQKASKPTITKEQRRERFTAIAKKRREKERRRDERRGVIKSGARGGAGRDDGGNRATGDAEGAANKLYCLGCRGKGHLIKDCKKATARAASVVCYRCGSTEHTLKGCPEEARARDKRAVTTFATCFVCGERGHLSAACAQNARGIYPKGGCCKICESVRHLASDCPERGTKRDRFAQQAAVPAAAAAAGGGGGSIQQPKGKKIVFGDEDAFDLGEGEEGGGGGEGAQPPPAKKQKKAKVVKF
ncbi:hypothetical protein JKP88DRAFT_206822 [Tribonema minus]|uniref:CCHC-type domain-containing protein n=1 Tax=Tribonema minus TaxID=303371 RepID=A0A835ZFQ1_9STRA|nr:hypothetical protein JKP88DRAFT_206822 [Tribonema minus]